MDYYKRANELKEDTIEIRRYLHKNAEVGLDLPNTVEYVMKQLKEYGIQPQLCGHGVTATIGKGKPVILLGNTFYYDLDICYKPSNKKEIYSLIVSQLEPKSNLDSIKYAYYLFHRYDCERWKYVDFDEIHFNLLGKDIECANYQKFMGSNFLFAIRHLIIIGIVKLTSLFKL